MTVDLPTPPFPDATAMTLAMPPVVVFSGARGGAALLDDYQYRLIGEFAFEQFLGLVFDFHCERVAGLGEAEYDGDFSGR